jgi:hypothetical protein
MDRAVEQGVKTSNPFTPASFFLSHGSAWKFHQHFSQKKLDRFFEIK